MKKTEVTKIEFFVDGHDHEDIAQILVALRKLRIGHIEVTRGSIKKKEIAEFENEDGKSEICSTDLGKFVGIKRRGVYLGEYVSKMKYPKMRFMEKK